MENKEVKKKLMYLSGEDFYLFCYSVLVALDHLKCRDGSYFKDYRKLAFLIEFIRDEKLNYIIASASESPDRTLNPVDREYLFTSYSVGLGRRSEILKLLFTLEKRKFVTLDKANTRSMVNVTLNPEEIPSAFFDKEMFGKEYKNMESFSALVKRLSTLKLETMLERVYGNNGISTWAV